MQQGRVTAVACKNSLQFVLRICGRMSHATAHMRSYVARTLRVRSRGEVATTCDVVWRTLRFVNTGVCKSSGV